MSAPKPLYKGDITLERKGEVVYGWPSMPRLHELPRKAVVCVDYTTCLYPGLVDPKPGLQFGNADSVSNADLSRAVVFESLAECYQWLDVQVESYANAIHDAWKLEVE